MKVLFLDIDGVLNSADWFAAQPPTRKAPATVDPRAVERIRRVCARTGAKIVLSSTWRLCTELREYLETLLPIYDVTPDLAPAPRAKEILAWLAAHAGNKPIRFAIIDDDVDADVGSGFVRTRWKHGMYGRHERALIEILGEVEAPARG